MGVIDWPLDGDPAIRWQALGDLGDASPDEIAAERARVEHDGWGVRLLSPAGGIGWRAPSWDGGRASRRRPKPPPPATGYGHRTDGPAAKEAAMPSRSETIAIQGPPGGGWAALRGLWDGARGTSAWPTWSLWC